MWAIAEIRFMVRRSQARELDRSPVNARSKTMTRAIWIAKCTIAAVTLVALAGCAYDQDPYAGEDGFYATSYPYDDGLYDGAYGPDFFFDGHHFHHEPFHHVDHFDHFGHGGHAGFAHVGGFGGIHMAHAGGFGGHAGGARG
jgi:hypothetical protein